MGNISRVTPLNKTAVDYTYDGQNKLRKETKGTTVEGIYDIDTYGNIRSKQWKDSNGVRNYTFTYSSGGAAWMDQIKTDAVRLLVQKRVFKGKIGLINLFFSVEWECVK